MKLYAVKCENQYLRKKEEDIILVPLSKASVFPSMDDALCLRDSFGHGKIAEMVLSEILLDL